MRGISWLAAKPVSFSRRTLLHGVSMKRLRSIRAYTFTDACVPHRVLNASCYSVSLMKVQFEPKHVRESTIQNTRYLHLPHKCVMLLVKKQWLTNMWNMQHYRTFRRFMSHESVFVGLSFLKQNKDKAGSADWNNLWNLHDSVWAWIYQPRIPRILAC